MPLFRLAACGAILLGIFSGGVFGQSDQDLTTPGNWITLHNEPPETVEFLTSLAGFRITDLEISSSSPLRFNGVLVSNVGEYAKSWWWYYGVNEDFVIERINTLGARIIALDVYQVGGEQRLAVVMIQNSGEDAAGWWWWYNVSPSFLSDFVAANNARIIDLDTYTIEGTRYYSAVMIHNVGAHQRGWWWYFNVSPGFIGDRIVENYARLIDLEPHDIASQTFSCVMVEVQGEHWWWYYGLTESQLSDRINQTGSRPIDLERYSTGAGTRFTVVLNNNSNALTTRIGQLLRLGTDGVSGCYLKEVGGSVLADLQSQRVFEPASMIKVLHHVHAMMAVRDDEIELSDTIPTFGGGANDCPQDSGPFNIRLETCLQQMMENSHNPRTQAVRTFFGEANINDTAEALGMNQTLLRHRMGCAAGADGALAEPNQLTLADAGRLYEAVANGLLDAGRVDWTDKFYELMIDGLSDPVATIINAEAAAAGMGALPRESFRDLVYEASKGGSYTFCTPGCIYHQTRGGWIRVPFKASCGEAFFREYVKGTFVNTASNNNAAAAAAGDAFAEIIREQVREAIDSWLTCPLDINHDGAVDAFDFQAFFNCLTGPEGGIIKTCGTFNTDRDSDIDLLNFQDLQNTFNPNGAP